MNGHKRLKLKKKLQKLNYQKEFEERYFGEAHLISPLACKIGDIKEELFNIELNLREVKNGN